MVKEDSSEALNSYISLNIEKLENRFEKIEKV